MIETIFEHPTIPATGYFDVLTCDVKKQMVRVSSLYVSGLRYLEGNGLLTQLDHDDGAACRREDLVDWTLSMSSVMIRFHLCLFKHSRQFVPSKYDHACNFP